ncbi:MAG: VWA domain-containing protein [Pyrinomonadaceae bacterium]
MLSAKVTSALVINILVLCLANAQTRKTPLPKPEDKKTEAQQDVDTIKTDTDLVTVPVIATDRAGMYVPDLKQDEFSIVEDGVKQEISFFGTVSAPFHVILMLDTSASTQEKLPAIQRAAYAFLEQLQAADRVKIITFDTEIRDLNDFTNDRALLRSAVKSTQSGTGTKVYDAFSVALDQVRRIQGRKAIVIFTDGVDWHSDLATFDSTLRGLDEEGVIVYPIRYDTRADTERIAREQAEDAAPQLPTIDVIRRAPGGTTPTTFPSDNPDAVPNSGRIPTSGPFGLPLPDEILRRRRESERNRDPSRTGLPTSGTLPPDRRTGGIPPGPSSQRGSQPDDSISAMLDMAYSQADQYLKSLADKSGGKLVRADTLESLPNAFAEIAAELRTQYLLGYYPINKAHDERYRKIKVTSARKNVVIRSRPGYKR